MKVLVACEFSGRQKGNKMGKMNETTISQAEEPNANTKPKAHHCKPHYKAKSLTLRGWLVAACVIIILLICFIAGLLWAVHLEAVDNASIITIEPLRKK